MFAHFIVSVCVVKLIEIYLIYLKFSFILTQVGTKVAAVSRKTNTTTHEVLGVMTKGNTQIVCHMSFISSLHYNFDIRGQEVNVQ